MTADPTDDQPVTPHAGGEQPADGADGGSPAEPEAHLGTRDDPAWVTELVYRLGGRHKDRDDCMFLDLLTEQGDWIGHRRGFPWRQNSRMLRADHRHTLALVGPAVAGEMAEALGRAAGDLDLIFGIESPTDNERARARERCDQLIGAQAAAAGPNGKMHVILRHDGDDTFEMRRREADAS